MLRHSLSVVRIVPFLAVICSLPGLADDRVDFFNLANELNPPIKARGAAADEINQVNFTDEANVVARFDVVERSAEPGIAVSRGSDPAPKPESVGSETAPDRHFGCLTCRPCPCVYGDVEFLFLQEVSRFRTQPIAVDWISGTTLQSTSDLSSGDVPGLQITFGMRLCDCRAIEFGYFGLFRNGGSTVFQNSNPNAEVTFPTGPVGNVFLNMDRVESDYSSYLNSFELNFPCCCGCCCAA